MSKSRTTLFPNGVSNASANSFAALANLRTLDNFKYFGTVDDFDNGYTAARYSIAGEGTEVVALAAGNGGVLSLATGASDTNNVSITAEELNILFSTSKELWFFATLQADVVDDSYLLAGITDGAADPIADLPEDGIYFRKDDGDANIDFVVRSGDAEVVLSAAVATITAATDIELAFHYDGVGGLSAYVDGALVYNATLAAASLPAAVLMTGQVFCETGAAAAVTVLLDNILAMRER